MNIHRDLNLETPQIHTHKTDGQLVLEPHKGIPCSYETEWTMVAPDDSDESYRHTKGKKPDSGKSLPCDSADRGSRVGRTSLW